MALTADQLLERRAYLGGTDAAALAGVNPPGWAQPIDVYLDKVGLRPDRPRTTMMAMGNLMEALVSDLFTEATGIKLRRPAGPVRSRDYPWAGGHVDRWAADGGLFEAKWAMRKDEWGEGIRPGTDDEPAIIPGPYDPAPRVPARYAVQCQHYLAVTGRPVAYLAVLLGYGDFRWYALWRDDVVISKLMALEERFWHDNVLAGVPPPPDGSDAYDRHLRAKYGVDDGLEVVATPEQQGLAHLARVAVEDLALATKAKQAAYQRLMDSMGTAAKLIGPSWHVTWKRNKPGLKVEWEDLATRLLSQAYPDAEPRALLELPDVWPTTKKAQAELVRAAARQLGLAEETEGARPFTLTFDDEETD